jgi:uncharacterized membrane protein (Fun14 family)
MFRSHARRAAGKAKSETLLVIALLVGWFALQVFVLPQLGIST